ncbi:MAG: RusA family crossover junction endodeoxyribonuclease [Nitrospira sp.]
MTPVPVNGSATSLKLAPLSSKAIVRNPYHPSIITSDTLTVTLPVPPSINHQYATVNGRRLLSSAGRAYKTCVGRQVWLALAQSPAGLSLRDRLQSGSLALTIRFFFASALRRDLDGGLKIAQDAVCEGLGLNDNRIIETHLYKQVDKTDPRMEVSLSFLHSPHHSA